MIEPNFRVRIKQNDLDRLRRQSPQRAGRAIRVLANEGVNKAKMLMQESPATGREYARGRKTHIASSPGQPPRPDMGTLMNSIHVVDVGPLTKHIADGVEYGEMQEFGTEDMEARPFMTPMVIWLEDQIPAVFDQFLEK